MPLRWILSVSRFQIGIHLFKLPFSNLEVTPKDTFIYQNSSFWGSRFWSYFTLTHRSYFAPFLTIVFETLKSLEILCLSTSVGCAGSSRGSGVDPALHAPWCHGSPSRVSRTQKGERPKTRREGDFFSDVKLIVLFFPEFLQSGGLLCLGKWETWKDDGRFLEFGDKKQEQNAAVDVRISIQIPLFLS